MANPRQRSAAYLMIVMAIGQALLLLSFAWIASATALRPEDYRTKIELPLWFAILPTAVAISVGAHIFLSRHADRTCPWVGLGWLLLAANIGALMMYMLMTA